MPVWVIFAAPGQFAIWSGRRRWALEQAHSKRLGAVVGAQLLDQGVDGFITVDRTRSNPLPMASKGGAHTATQALVPFDCLCH